MGGWHRLATRFRSAAAINGEERRFASMTLGSGFFPARYRNTLFLTVARSGIGLSVLFLLRLLHPPLFIPWAEVEPVVRERSWMKNHVAVSLRGFDKRLLFRGQAGKKILETYNPNTPPGGAPVSRIRR
jgi:hypothetical protein